MSAEVGRLERHGLQSNFEQLIRQQRAKSTGRSDARTTDLVELAHRHLIDGARCIQALGGLVDGIENL
jgi:muramoyltetrapeptide carboxypeptidase LdcA involved in peptidoglycan recycling